VEADDPDQKYFDKMGNYCPAGLPAFLLWGPIMPEGADDTYRAKVFFIPPEQLQGVKKPGGGSSRASKKKDGRSSIRQEVSEAKAEERAAAPVADGRGYNPQQMFMAAQIAQSSTILLVCSKFLSSTRLNLPIYRILLRGVKKGKRLIWKRFPQHIG
jgi:hypothetical protein